jgi:hypothetical protein
MQVEILSIQTIKLEFCLLFVLGFTAFDALVCGTLHHASRPSDVWYFGDFNR